MSNLQVKTDRGRNLLYLGAAGDADMKRMFNSVGEGLSLWKKKLTPSILLVIVSQYSMKALAGFFYKENIVQQHRQVIHRLQV